MIGDKPLSEIRKEVFERLKAAGVSPDTFQQMLDQLSPPKREGNPKAVKALVKFAKPIRPKKRSRTPTKSRG